MRTRLMCTFFFLLFAASCGDMIPPEDAPSPNAPAASPGAAGEAGESDARGEGAGAHGESTAPADPGCGLPTFGCLGEVLVVSDDCTENVLVADCGADGLVCIAGECMDVGDDCEADEERYCDGSIIRVHNASGECGADEMLRDCAPDGCDHGECVCDSPPMTYCDGETIVHEDPCDLDATSVEACGPDESCFDGECQEVPDCRADTDCAVAGRLVGEGPWSECGGFSDVCDDTGSQTPSCAKTRPKRFARPCQDRQRRGSVLRGPRLRSRTI